MLSGFKGVHPNIGENVYIAPGAHIIGKVTIGSGSSVWFNAVIRGDMDKIEIGQETSIQDNCTIHTDEGSPASIGDRVTVGHNVVLHGCTVEDDALVGMGSVVLDGAIVGRGSVIGAGSVVTSGTVIPPGTLALGSPAKVLRQLTPKKNGDNEDLPYRSYNRIVAVYLDEQEKR